MATKKPVKFSKNRKINSNFIDVLGIKKDYVCLPHKVKEIIIESSWPKLSLDIDQSLDFENIELIVEEIKTNLSKSFLTINNKNISLLESSNILAIDSVIFSLERTISGRTTIREKEKIIGKSIKSFCEKSGNATYDAAKKVWTGSAVMFSNIVWSTISQYYRFDKKGLYYNFIKSKNSSYKKNHCISIKSFGPQPRVFKVEGKPRESYLCKRVTNEGISESVLPKNAIGNFGPLKVYVQEHAIKRIMERLKLNSYGDIFWSISNSLINPVVSSKDFDCFFIDFYYGKYKLGYLLVSLEEDAALIRTFKFITMFGTPEYFNLKKELGGVREDFEYLGMDSLELINSDVFADPKLVKIFKKCGLGHLFELKKNVTFDAPQSLMAGEIKKYFRIGA